MASKFYDDGLQGMTAGGGISWTADTLKVLLLKDSATFDKTDNYVADVISGSLEISVTSYARGTLASKTKSYDSTTQTVKFDAADQDFGSLESGQTVGAAVVYKEVTGDSDSIPVCFCDDASDLILNGGNVTVSWSSDGICRIVGQ